MAAFVRVCGPPNSNYLVGYPGISATLVSAAHNFQSHLLWGYLNEEIMHEE